MLMLAPRLHNTSRGSVYRIGMKVNRPQVRTAVAANVRALMDRRELTQMQLCAKSGVSQRHISNLINAKGGPGAEVLDAVASAFGLPGWLLMIPGLSVEILDSHSIPLLVESFISAGPEGRELIARLAEREATHNLEKQKILPFRKR